MIFALLQNDTEQENRLFSSCADLIEETFSPQIEVVQALNLRVSGKDYQQQKASARELVHSIERLTVGGLSWHEEAELLYFIEKIGTRYGFKKELQENGIL